MGRSEQSIPIEQTAADVYSKVQQEVSIARQALARRDAEMAITMFQSALRKLGPGQPFYDHLVHNLLLSYKLMIDQLLEEGHRADALGLLPPVLNLEMQPDAELDPELIKRFAGAYQTIGLTYFKSRMIEASVACFRKSLSITRAPGFNVNLANALAAGGIRAELSDFTTDLTPDQLGRHIFIACVPKSASTFLKNLLVSVTGYQDVFMVYAAGQNEHDLYLPTVRDTAHLDTVTQQHCRASDATVQMMQAFGIRPVVLVRNIFDSVMSLLDFYNHGASNTSYFRADFKSLDDETKVDLLIDNVIPWYFQFVASWDQVDKQQSLDIHWLSYEELIADKPGAVKNILEFYGLGAPRRGIEQKIKETSAAKRGTRFNKGVAGRGQSGLSEAQKERIRGLCRYYPSTDFSRIGL